MSYHVSAVGNSFAVPCLGICFYATQTHKNNSSHYCLNYKAYLLTTLTF